MNKKTFNQINKSFKTKFGQAYTKDFIELQLPQVLKALSHRVSVTSDFGIVGPVNSTINSIADVTTGIASLEHYFFKDYEQYIGSYGAAAYYGKYGRFTMPDVLDTFNVFTRLFEDCGLEIYPSDHVIKISFREYGIPEFRYIWKSDLICIDSFRLSLLEHVKKHKYKPELYHEYGMFDFLCSIAFLKFSYWPLEITNFKCHQNLKGLYFLLAKSLNKFTTSERNKFFPPSVFSKNLRKLLETEFYWRAFLTYTNFKSENLVEPNSTPRYKKAKVYLSKDYIPIAYWENNHYFSIDNKLGKLNSILNFSDQDDSAVTLAILNEKFKNQLEDNSMHVIEFEVKNKKGNKTFAAYLNSIVHKKNDRFDLNFANRLLLTKFEYKQQIIESKMRLQSKLDIFKTEKKTRAINDEASILVKSLDNFIAVQNTKYEYDDVEPPLSFTLLHAEIAHFKSMYKIFLEKSMSRIDSITTPAIDGFETRNRELKNFIKEINKKMLKFLTLS